MDSTTHYVNGINDIVHQELTGFPDLRAPSANDFFSDTRGIVSSASSKSTEDVTEDFLSAGFAVPSAPSHDPKFFSADGQIAHNAEPVIMAAHSV